ncbi:MAG TPA: hypothetical protein VJ553_07365 [Candidatus Paceibacterota bacterium]|nr:hypothetical protein [Candidatus Paceibacterota bacterium]
MARFTKGMKVWKTFYGIGGFTASCEDVVESVKNGVVRTEECENGITFDAVTGKELENFFPGMHQEIVPLAEHLKKPTAAPKKASPPRPGKATPKPTPVRRESSGRLTLEDCANPMFDRQRPVRRLERCRGRSEPVFEWVTVTDQYVQVGITYFLRDGTLSVVAFEPRNAQLYNGIVRTPDEFAKAMKAVDRKYKRLR